MRRNYLEAALHRQVAHFLQVALYPETWFTTFPLGGGGYIHGAINKGLGARKGTPDVLIIHGGRAIWCELKSTTGRLSDDQKATHTALVVAGSVVTVIRSLDELIGFLKVLGIPMRAR